MIFVTKPFIPPIEEYTRLLEEVWKREWITNNGPLVQQLEKDLESYLGVNNLLFTGNGTIALQIAIKALELKGEIITTPFSYVATSSSVVWEGCTPVFADIDPGTFNLDPGKIEELITDRTTGILATHVFGNPCDVEEIKQIADKHGLKVIYDAAHCFGTKYKGESVFKWGDISTASFHATKIYHTTEGGAVISSDEALTSKMAYMRNFGHDGPYKFNGVGINGKNSELHAAMGVLNLKYIDEILERRKKQYQRYEEALAPYLQLQLIKEEVEINHSYFPIVFESEKSLLKVEKALEDEEILTRRYFYPSLHTLDYVSGVAPIAEAISSRVLCLPMYHTLAAASQAKIITIIKGEL